MSVSLPDAAATDDMETGTGNACVAELCDGFDNDCDERVDELLLAPEHPGVVSTSPKAHDSGAKLALARRTGNGAWFFIGPPTTVGPQEGVTIYQLDDQGRIVSAVPSAMQQLEAADDFALDAHESVVALGHRTKEGPIRVSLFASADLSLIGQGVIDGSEGTYVKDVSLLHGSDGVTRVLVASTDTPKVSLHVLALQPQGVLTVNSVKTLEGTSTWGTQYGFDVVEIERADCHGEWIVSLQEHGGAGQYDGITAVHLDGTLGDASLSRKVFRTIVRKPTNCAVEGDEFLAGGLHFKNGASTRGFSTLHWSEDGKFVSTADELIEVNLDPLTMAATFYGGRWIVAGRMAQNPKKASAFELHFGARSAHEIVLYTSAVGANPGGGGGDNSSAVATLGSRVLLALDNQRIQNVDQEISNLDAMRSEGDVNPAVAVTYSLGCTEP